LIVLNKEERKVLIELIENIRMYRNDIIHGKELSCSIHELEEHLGAAYQNIESFEILMKNILKK
jgi:hypothetical protein